MGHVRPGSSLPRADGRAAPPVARAPGRLDGSSPSRSGRRSCATRARAAWTAASPSATARAARWRTGSPSSTTWSTGASGSEALVAPQRPTTSPRSPAGSAPRRARPPARCRSTTCPVTIKQIEWPSSSGGSPRGGSCPARPAVAPGHAVAVIGTGPAGPGRGPAARPSRPRRDRLREGRRIRAACCATASPTSSSRSRCSTGAWSRWTPRGCTSSPASRSARTSRRATCAGRFDAVLLAMGAGEPRDLAVAGPRAGRRALRHGLPLPPNRLVAGEAGRDTLIDAEGQAGARDRRRRHGQRLRGHGHPPGRRVGDAVRDPAEAARVGRVVEPELAGVAGDPPHHQLARGGLRARLGHRDRAPRRRGGRGGARRVPPGRAAAGDGGGAGIRVHEGVRPGAARHGLPARAPRAAAAGPRRRAGRARQRARRRDRPHDRAQRVGSGRHGDRRLARGARDLPGTGGGPGDDGYLAG